MGKKIILKKMKFIYALLIFCFLLFVSCESLKETQNFYENSIVKEYPEIIENGTIDSFNGSIKINKAPSKTILGTYKVYSELVGNIKLSGQESSEIYMEGEAFLNDKKGYNLFPCSISNCYAFIGNKKIHIDFNFDNYYQNSLFNPIILIDDEYEIYKCRCKEYLKKNGEKYYSPDMNDIYEEYQKFQLFEKTESNKTLLAEWFDNSYTIYISEDLLVSEIKKLLGCVILRIEWSNFFNQPDCAKKGIERIDSFEFSF